MSIQFSDATNKSGIVEIIDRRVKTDSVSYPIEDKTADINLALDYIYATIFDCGGTWQFDDSNHTKYPIITTDLVSGQRDYSFVTDEQGNLILDIYKVMVKGSDGVYKEITPVDMQSDENMAGFNDGKNLTGEVTQYDKTANGIFLNKIPSYDSSGGLKIYINREGSHFVKTDTTKKAGFAGLFHEYLVLKPAYQYAVTNGVPSANALGQEMLMMEKKIKDYYGNRERDVRRRMTANVESNK